MMDSVLSFIRANPACLSRDIVSSTGINMRKVVAATQMLYRDGIIDRHAGLFARWSVRPPAMPSISVNGKLYQRWAAEAKRSGIPLQQLVAQALEAV